MLIEGQPNNYAKLVKNRPNVISFNRAICEEEGTVTFSSDGDLTSGIQNQMADGFIAKFRNKKYAPGVEVPCGPISSLLHQANVTSIELFSVDVEGSELFVLNTMDWSIPVFVLVIEMDGFDIEKDKQKHAILLEQGFIEYTNIKIKKTGVYINPRYEQMVSLYL